MRLFAIPHLEKVMKTKRLMPALLLALLPVFAGCASGHYGAAVIKSSPPGAEVVDLTDDSLIGVTPVTAWWKAGEEDRRFVNIRFQKDGYRDKTMSFWLNTRHGSREDALARPQVIEAILGKTTNPQ